MQFFWKISCSFKRSQSCGAVATGAANGREIFGNGRGPSTLAFPSQYSSLSLFLSFILFLSSKCYWKLLRNNTFSRQLQKRATRKELEEQKRPKQTKTKENFALPIAYLSAWRGGVFTVLARLTGETVGAVTATAAAFNSRHPWRLPAY